MVDYKKAFEKSVKYIEDDCGCCPACYDHTLEKDKCLVCNLAITDSRKTDYDKQLSIQCWKEIFM